MNASRPGSWWLGGALVITAAAAALLYTDLHRLSERLERRRPLLERARTRDRLLQRRLPDLRLPVVGADTSRDLQGDTDPQLVVVVSPDRCVQCLEGLSDWHRAVRRRDIDAVMILADVGPARAETIVRESGLRGTVLADPEGTADRRFGWSPPPGMAVLTVSPDRTIRSVAVRRSRGGCRWSALDRAVALLGGEGPGRPAARVTAAPRPARGPVGRTAQAEPSSPSRSSRAVSSSSDSASSSVVSAAVGEPWKRRSISRSRAPRWASARLTTGKYR